ncbi:hypothetical protein [Butyrivibrio sp. VCB2001]|uniref:hypothetical protein n=1 Tax=Butyrivibrio sp. VCB2001 TaxID=1280667 RepID=UPI000423D877|nr:hypothetical protein [Butyrivibrio sp. VCB2001]
MATSSIFHNVVINDPKKADAFISAIEASIADPYKRNEKTPVTKVESDPKKISHILDMWKKEAVN